MAAHGRFSILRRCPVRLNLRRRVRPATGPPCPPCAILQHLNIGIWAYIPKCAKVAVGRRARLVQLCRVRFFGLPDTRSVPGNSMSMTLCLHDGACPHLRNSGREQPCAIGNTRGAVRTNCPVRACMLYRTRLMYRYRAPVMAPPSTLRYCPHMPHVRSMPESARLHVDSTQPVNIILENAR